MRKSKLTPQEVQEAEMAADSRKHHRAAGFSLMDVRDRGWIRLSTGQYMFWHVDRPLENNETRQSVPEGHFLIKTNQEDMLFDADDFRKSLRWV